MPGAETGRTIAFSVKHFAVQPLNGTNLAIGVPITIDTPETAELKIDVTLDEIRGGAYLFPLAADPKEMKGEFSFKLTDCPYGLASLLLNGAYTKVTAAGPALDALGVYNLQGTSVATRCTVTPVAAPAVTGDYAIVATAAQAYSVYDLSTGKAAASVTTMSGMTTTDTTSVPGVTISTASGTFIVNDAGNFHIVNVGGAGGGMTAIQETVTGPSSYPVTPPQVRITGQAQRRGTIWRFMLYYCELEGIALPMGQGKYVVPDGKARILQPPFNSSFSAPYQLSYVA
jgi:hypothetical protein